MLADYCNLRIAWPPAIGEIGRRQRGLREPKPLASPSIWQPSGDGFGQPSGAASSHNLGSKSVETKPRPSQCGVGRCTELSREQFKDFWAGYPPSIHATAGPNATAIMPTAAARMTTATATKSIRASPIGASGDNLTEALRQLREPFHTAR